MKKLSYFFFIFLFISCSEDTTGPGKSNQYSYVVDAVVQEINLARTDPNYYVTLLEEAKKNFDGLIYNDPYGKPVQTTEGVAAFNETIEYLKASPVLPPLNEVAGISRAAQEYAEYQGSGDLTGHYSEDGSSPGDRMKKFGTFGASFGWSENLIYGPNDNAISLVIAWIVDDGVPDRGHRINIFDENMTQFGIGFAEHKTYTYECVVNFAFGFIPNLP